MDTKILFARLFRYPFVLHWLVILLLGLVIFLVQWSSDNQIERGPHATTFIQKHNPGSHRFSNEHKRGDHNDHVFHWHGHEHMVHTTESITSTSPDHSTFVINDFKDTYLVGDTLHVTIVAKDFTGVPKTYGGDLFGAKVFSKELKASVFGEVLDHQNGTYSAQFTLPWAGSVAVGVYLIRSSESLKVRNRHWDTGSERVYFHGYFQGRNSEGEQVEERVECKTKWDGVVMSSQKDCCCEYQDAHMGLAWQCHRPPTLPCDSLVDYSIGGHRHHFKPYVKTFLKSHHDNQLLKGDTREIRVTHSKQYVTTGSRESCKPGLPAATPAGFYMNDVWTSFMCATRAFSVTDTTRCLHGKHIYLMGDGTSRLWFDFFLESVPTLKRTYLQSLFQVGPVLAVDVENNITMSYSTRGLPLRCLKTPTTTVLRSSTETHDDDEDDDVGGPQTIIVYTLNLYGYSLTYYALHVSLVHWAVVELLKREPETKVIITTGPKDIFVNDQFPKQLHEILIEAFRDVGVYILDVWQMTDTDIHPVPVIIKNEIDILLSFICSK